MSINSVSYSNNNVDNDSEGSKVMELDALKTENALEQSTVFEISVVDHLEPERPQSVLSERMSENEDFSGASLSISTASSSDLEEHRHLRQLLTSPALHESYSSFCSTCSESELSCSTLEGDSPLTTDTEGSSWREEYSDDDGHYNLIQPPLTSELNLEFWPLSAGSDDDSNNSSFDELENSLCKQQSSSQEDKEDKLKESEEESVLCVQCHAWPEVEDCSGEQTLAIALIIAFLFLL